MRLFHTTQVYQKIGFKNGSKSNESDQMDRLSRATRFWLWFIIMDYGFWVEEKLFNCDLIVFDTVVKYKLRQKLDKNL